MDNRSSLLGHAAPPQRRAAAGDLVSILSGLASLPRSPTDAGILFARDTTVPPSVQEFAWRVIEKRCSYQSHERGQRSFWAYEARTRRVAADIVYSISILSEVMWKKTEPPPSST
jgi:hypothetical protein